VDGDDDVDVGEVAAGEDDDEDVAMSGEKSSAIVVEVQVVDWMAGESGACVDSE
jgi:hypothetical protein